MVTSLIYGPVPSWRLGRSLGIDLISTDQKTCTFDCIYCQLGKTVYHTSERRMFVDDMTLENALDTLGPVEADYVTFSGVGEPTLAANLDRAIGMARNALHLPVAVLTNSSLINRQDVRSALAIADVVVAKVDAPNEELFQAISRPGYTIRLEQILEGIESFRRSYNGKLALQMMFVPQNQHMAPQMADIARNLGADEVQLNTPLRPSPVLPLVASEMEAIEACFANIPTANVYRAGRPQVRPFNMEETLRRRPVL
jgi:wyosine [tRNA(Phe)-imidazoG37] synthetase (radical SAM superfamily)